MLSPVYTLHTLIVRSPDPEAKHSPFEEKATLLTRSEWPMKVLMCAQFYSLHNLIVLSVDPEAKYSPFGENAILKTQP